MYEQVGGSTKPSGVALDWTTALAVGATTEGEAATGVGAPPQLASTTERTARVAATLSISEIVRTCGCRPHNETVMTKAQPAAAKSLEIGARTGGRQARARD
jgi:hypothetical protein